MQAVLGEGRPRHLFLSVLVAVMVAWTATALAIGPTTLVDRLGEENGYIVAFLTACLGGVSSLTGASFLTAVATLSAGGLDPVRLGIAAGLGATISDGVFYLLGHEGREAIPRRLEPRLTRASQWLKRRPPWFVPVVVLVYTASAPLPSDLLLLSLGLADIPFRRVVVPLLLGNCIFLTWFGYLAGRGLKLFA